MYSIVHSSDNLELILASDQLLTQLKIADWSNANIIHPCQTLLLAIQAIREKFESRKFREEARKAKQKNRISNVTQIAGIDFPHRIACNHIKFRLTQIASTAAIRTRRTIPFEFTKNWPRSLQLPKTWFALIRLLSLMSVSTSRLHPYP